MLYLLLRLAILMACCLCLSNACKVRNWRHFPMEEVLYKADIVVTGREIYRSEVNDPDGPFSTRMDATFEVYCVFKNDNLEAPIPARITVEEVFPRNTCSGTKVSQDTSYIVALRRIGDNFEWHEVNAQDSAAYEATAQNLEAAMKVCYLENPILPQGHDSDISCPNPSKAKKVATDCLKFSYDFSTPPPGPPGVQNPTVRGGISDSGNGGFKTPPTGQSKNGGSFITPPPAPPGQPRPTVRGGTPDSGNGGHFNTSPPPKGRGDNQGSGNEPDNPTPRWGSPDPENGFFNTPPPGRPGLLRPTPRRRFFTS